MKKSGVIKKEERRKKKEEERCTHTRASLPSLQPISYLF